MKTHEILADGQQFVFQVIKNTTQPCPVCGVPACGKEDILWYEHNDQRIAIIFNGGSFDLVGQEFFRKNLKTINYDSLPEFMKEWNELRGWEDCWDYEGYPLDIDDFLKSILLLKPCNTEEWLTNDDLNDMQVLAIEARKKGAKLKIVRG